MSGKTNPIKPTDTQVVKNLKQLVQIYTTQKKLAKALNKSLCTVSSWINYTYIPNEDSLFAITALAKYHGIIEDIE